MAQKDLLSVIQQLMEQGDNTVNKKNQVDQQEKQKTSPDTQGVLGQDGKALDAGGDKDVGGKKGSNPSDSSNDTQGVLGKDGKALDAGGDKDVGGKKGSNPSKASPDTQGIQGKTSGKALDAGGDKDVGKLKEQKMKEGNAVTAKAAAAKMAGKKEFELDGKKMPVTISKDTAKQVAKEELVGGQKKLDINKDGKISADDLKKVRDGKVNEEQQNDVNKKNQVDKQEKQKTSPDTQGVLGKDGKALDAGGDKDVGKLKEGTVELSIEVDADELAQIAQSGQDEVDLDDISVDGEDQEDEVPGDATNIEPDVAGDEAPKDHPVPGADDDQDGIPNDAETDDDADQIPDDQEDQDADDVPDDMEKEEEATDPAAKLAELESEIDALKKQLSQTEEEEESPADEAGESPEHEAGETSGDEAAEKEGEEEVEEEEEEGEKSEKPFPPKKDEEESDTLEEDFKQKATIIFETAVNQKVKTIKEELQQQYATLLEKEMEVANSKINEYVDYAVKEWLKENKLEIKYSLRTEIAENFVRGLRTLFKDNYIDIPEEQVSVVDELTEAVESYKEQLEESSKALDEVRSELLSIKRSEVFEEVAEGMTETQKIRLEKLSESVEASDIDEFRFKVEQLKESFFDGTSESPLLGSLSEEVFGTRTQEIEDPAVSQYASFLSRTVLK